MKRRESLAIVPCCITQRASDPRHVETSEMWPPRVDKGTMLEAGRITNSRARQRWRQPLISTGGPCP
jgi:hypothetical protein